MVRLKSRYLLVQVLYPQHSSVLAVHASTPDNITAAYLTRLVRAQVVQMFGDHGAGALGSSLAIKYWSNATSTFILRCSRACARMLWAALTFITKWKIPGQYEQTSGTGEQEREIILLQVLRVSGTLRKCEHEAIRRAKVLCGRARGIDAALAAGVTVHNETYELQEREGDHIGIPEDMDAAELMQLEDSDQPESVDDGSD